MSNSDASVIDLTESSFCLVDHRSLSDLVIEIDDTDDSIVEIKTPQRKNTKRQKNSLNTEAKKVESPAVKIGECSICYEKLGRNPLASTTCGHIFCVKCIETALKHDNKCPQCRKVLKGLKFHRIFL